MRIALYTGSFDPLTNGHVDVIRSAAFVCDRLIVGIGINPGKTPMFSFEERAALIQDACGRELAAAHCELKVETFSGLAVEAAKKASMRTRARKIRLEVIFGFLLLAPAELADGFGIPLLVVPTGGSPPDSPHAADAAVGFPASRLREFGAMRERPVADPRIVSVL